ncbi:MAG: radical SAM protein [Candidatus Omnitrophota bacterium]|nr:radical SAM protein [Candidatus Omnitrophota bacterium]
MEKFLLINPGHSYYEKTHRTSFYGSIGLPVGLLYIGAIAEKKGCDIRIIDALVCEHSTLIKTKDYIYYGVPADKLRTIIKEYLPDIVGISSQFATQEENVFGIARLVKEVSASTLVIVGGANTSCRGRFFLQDRCIDIVVKGEAETTISNLIDMYRGKQRLEDIKGILYRHENEIVESAQQPYIDSLDEIPLPAYHLVNMERYLTLYKKGIYVRDRDVKRSVSVITSRGCPYQCIFCSISQSMGKKWRAHSPEYVKQHLKLLSRTYQVKHIHFEDDNLLFEPERFIPVLETLAKERITWDTPNGICADLALNEIFLLQVKSSGCKSLTIGVESGDPDILKTVVKKSITLEEVVEFARRCKVVKLPLRAFFILGFPGENLTTMRHTIDFALLLLEEYNVEIINLIATPLYGTELYRVCEDNKYFTKKITPEALSESIVPDGCCLIQTGQFSSQEVERLSKLFTAKVYRKLFMKGIYHPWASLRRIGNTYSLLRTLKRLFS